MERAVKHNHFEWLKYLWAFEQNYYGENPNEYQLVDFNMLFGIINNQKDQENEYK